MPPSPVPSPVPGRPRPVFARHAASLLVVRDGPDGPEVLMGRRAQAHRFMPDALVFPGGAVDPGDGAAAAAAEPRPELLAVLGRRARPRLARGLAVCAARELLEETGLSLGEPPRLDGMEYLCRAVTPPNSPIRFNARFLVVSARHVTGTMGDSRELLDVGFRSVRHLPPDSLMLVTAAVLQRFIEWHGRREAGGQAGTDLFVFRQKAWAPD